MNKEEMIKKERIAILQNFAETYLKRNGFPPSNVLFKIPAEFGELTEEQTRVLHFYLVQEYKKMGMDLVSCIRKTGEEIVPGVLSKYEINEWIWRADGMIFFLGVLNMRIDTNKKNK